MEEKVNLKEKLGRLDRSPSNPDIVGYLNDYKLDGGQGAWASSSGTSTTRPMISSWFSRAISTIQLRDRDIELEPGELFVVPRGVEHCPQALIEGAEVLRDRAHRRPSTPATPEGS